MSDRTFKVGDSYMKGDDVRYWQRDIKVEFSKMDINCPIVVDGIYGVNTRSYTASLCHALGMNAGFSMREGVTPELRSKIRNRDLSPEEKQRFKSDEYEDYRRALRKRWARRAIDVHAPVTRIITSSWGYHPGVHDGIDVICPPNAVVFAMVRSKVIDVRSGGWWGKSPSGDVSKGDGIVQLEVLDSVGPFRKGYHIGYGHCEHANVNVGHIVRAGDPIARAGLAVAWHIHLMYNDGQTMKGVGNQDPRRILDYAVEHTN
jgi:murein DD-endopeptidase MepM/ murein hydrolase activator NlpD